MNHLLTYHLISQTSLYHIVSRTWMLPLHKETHIHRRILQDYLAETEKSQAVSNVSSATENEN